MQEVGLAAAYAVFGGLLLMIFVASLWLGWQMFIDALRSGFLSPADEIVRRLRRARH